LLSGCQIPKMSDAPRFEPRATGVFSNAAAGINVGRQLDSSLLQPPEDLFTLGPGDHIEIEIWGRPTSRRELTIGPDGKIYYDLLPGIDVWGMTLSEARRHLEERLNELYSGVQLSVALRGVGSKYIWMLGSVQKPGLYPTGAPTTLLEALSLAGGTRRSQSAITTVDTADLRHAFVVRQGEILPVDFQRLLEHGDMSQNIYLQPDDFIFVPSGAAREIYLFGAVRSPRAMPLSETPTLIAAITAGGGLAGDAYASQVAIVRGSLVNPQIAVVDYEEIIKGKAGDILLEPRDIVFVPRSPYRFIRNYLDAVLNTFVFTVAANEGANAFTENRRLGVAVPVGNQ